MTKPRVVFAILAGGKGERLWPLVRSANPKVCLSPDGSKTLLARTFERLKTAWPAASFFIITTQEQEKAIRKVLPKQKRIQLIIEPEGKNTAACITLAALAATRQDSNAILFTVPADHWVGQLKPFRQTAQTAIHMAAQEDCLVTIGIRPTHAHTGFGYLCAGKRVKKETGRPPAVFKVVRFVEKPSLSVARRLIGSSSTYWNSGMFAGKASVFIARIKRHLPQHYRQLSKAGLGNLTRVYPRLKPVSFDNGVMQHLRDTLVVQGNFPWEDLGSWDVWARLGGKTVRTLSLQSSRISTIGERGHLIVTLGVSNLLIVQTPTATLVCHADKAQSVREIARELASRASLKAYA